MIASKAIVAVLALMLALPAGGAAASNRFNYRYKVTTVDIDGTFTSKYDDGLGHTMTARERIVVWGESTKTDKDRRIKCALDKSNTCDFFVKSNFTLRNPAVPMLNANGNLRTSPFKRFYKIKATENRPDQPPVDCSREVEDEDNFGGSMWLKRRKVTAFWTLPAVAVRCDLNGGHASADPIDRTSGDPQAQFTEKYPLRHFRHRRVVLNIAIRHEWQQDSYTTNKIVWDGWVILKRVR